MNDIGKIPLLTMEEEVKLSRMIKNGDEDALERLITSNLRFVVSVAKKYQNKGLSLGDLINEGNFGLIKAAKRFDETKGFRFISFAVWWIRQTIILAIAEQTRIVRLPLSMVNSISKLNKAVAGLEQRLERLPTAEELSDETFVEKYKITDHLKKARRSVSLDALVNDDSGRTLLDVIIDHSPAPDHFTRMAASESAVSRILKVLSKREQRVLRLYFGLFGHPEVSLDDIGLIYNLSRERIRQLKDNGLKKLRLKAIEKNFNNTYRL